MQCKVKDCDSFSNHRACTISFFKFPREKSRAKMWKNFCRQVESFDTKNSVICMKHFTHDDFENERQFEMGFAKKRLLKPTAVPSIFDPLANSQLLSSKRAERNHRRENKKIIDKLLKSKDDATVAPHEEIVIDTLLRSTDCDTEAPHEENDETDSSVFNAHFEEFMFINTCNVEEESCKIREEVSRHYVEEIESLKKEIEELRGRNCYLQERDKKHLRDIAALKLRATNTKRRHKFQVKMLEQRLAQAEHGAKKVEDKFLRIFPT